MADIMMTLGDFQFSIDTAAYQGLKRETSWRWKQQERIGREPANQYIGPGNDRVTLDGSIYPHFRGGLGQLNAMRSMADEGEELRLVDGRGYVIGTYVITRISENQATFAAEGVPLKQDFQIELALYGEDGAASSGGGGDSSGGGGSPGGGNGWVSLANTVIGLFT